MLQENDLTLRLVMRFLKENQYGEALLQLEKDCTFTYDRYSKEVEFFKRMLVEGNYKEVMHFLGAFESKISQQDYRRIMLQLNKQRLYQLVENPKEQELRELLEKEIVNYCSEEEYQSLFYFLTLKNMRESPHFERWTPVVGRLNCFEFIRPFIDIINLGTRTPSRADSVRLEDVVKDYFHRHRLPARATELPGQPQHHPQQRQKYKYVQELGLQSRPEQPTQKEQMKPLASYKLDGQRNVVSFGRENMVIDNAQNQPQSTERLTDSVVRPDIAHNNFTFSQGQQKQHQDSRAISIRKAAFYRDTKAIRVSRFQPRGELLAVGTLNSSLKIFDVGGFKDEDPDQDPIEMLPLYEVNDIHQKSVFFLDWASKSDMIVTCSNDCSIKLTKFDNNFKRHTTKTMGKHEAPVRMVKFDYSGKQVVSCSEDMTVKVWDVEKGRIRNLDHSSPVNAIIWVEGDSNLVVSAEKDRTMRLWDCRTSQCSLSVDTFDSEILYIAQHGNKYCVSQRNGSITMVTEYFQDYMGLTLHEQEARSVEYSSEIKRFVSSSFDGQLCIFNEDATTTSYIAHNKQDESDNVVYAGVHPHGLIASCSRLGLCNIYLVD